MIEAQQHSDLFPGVKPSPTGIERNQPDGYIYDDEWRIPCTCEPGCPWACNGACGCHACHRLYQDALTLDYD